MAKERGYPQIFTDGLNRAATLPNLLFTYPDGDDVTHRYVEMIVKRFFGRLDPRVVIKSDREITDSDIQNCNIYIYGSPENHSLLARVQSQLPIQFESDGIVVGHKRYKGRDVGAIFTCPDPLAPQRRLIIYGAVSPEALRNMNGIFHGPTDFIVFDNRTRNFTRVNDADRFLVVGSFDKTDPEHWRVNEKLEMAPPKVLQRAVSNVVAAE